MIGILKLLAYVTVGLMIFKVLGRILDKVNPYRRAFISILFSAYLIVSGMCVIQSNIVGLIKVTYVAILQFLLYLIFEKCLKEVHTTKRFIAYFILTGILALGFAITSMDIYHALFCTNVTETIIRVVL